MQKLYPMIFLESQRRDIFAPVYKISVHSLGDIANGRFGIVAAYGGSKYSTAMETGCAAASAVLTAGVGSPSAPSV
jgi:hypothetical protein